MKKISKDNLNDFLEYYHSFHDSNIIGVNYDILNEKIQLLIDAFWCGEPILKNNKYETNKARLKLVFYNVIECNNKEIFSWDFMKEAYIKYIKLHNKEYLCFASDKEDPCIYIICDSIEYEEIK